MTTVTSFSDSATSAIAFSVCNFFVFFYYCLVVLWILIIIFYFFFVFCV